MLWLFFSPHTLFASARALEARGRFQRAVKRYRRCLLKMEKKAESDRGLQGGCALGLARCYRGRQCEEEARDWFLRALDYGAVDAESLVCLKGILLFCGDPATESVFLVRLETIIHARPELNWPRMRWAERIIPASRPPKSRLPLAIGRLEMGSLLDEFQPEGRLLLARAQLHLHRYEDVTASLRSWLEDPPDLARDRLGSLVFLYAAALAGLGRFRQCLACLQTFPAALETRHLQLRAFCHFRLAESELAFAILDRKLRPEALSPGSREIYLQLLLARGAFLKAGSFMDGFMPVRGKRPDLMATRAAIHEILGRKRTAAAAYRRLLDLKNPAPGIWAKVLSLELCDAQKEGRALAEVLRFVRAAKLADWHLEAPPLETLFGAEAYRRFCGDWLQELAVFLWRNRQSRDAVTFLGMFPPRVDSELSPIIATLSFWSGLKAFLGGGKAAGPHCWSGLKERLDGDALSVKIKQRLRILEQAPGSLEWRPAREVLARLEPNQRALLLSLALWQGKNRLAETLLGDDEDLFPDPMPFRLAMALARRDFPAAFQPLMARLQRDPKPPSPWTRDLLIGLALKTQDEKLIRTVAGFLNLDTAGAIGDRPGELGNGLDVPAALLLWNLQNDAALLSGDGGSWQGFLLKSAAAIRLQRPQKLLESIDEYMAGARLAGPRLAGPRLAAPHPRAGQLLCRMFAMLIVNSPPESLDLTRFCRAGRRFLTVFKQEPWRQTFFFALLRPAWLATAMVLLRGVPDHLAHDTRLLHHFGLAFWDRALAHEAAGSFSKAIHAWRLTLAFWAPVFESAQFKREFLASREKVYGKSIEPARFDRLFKAIEEKWLGHFSNIAGHELAPAGAGARGRAWGTSYRYLFYEFLRERCFIRRLLAARVSIPEFSGVLNLGPCFLKELDWQRSLFRVLGQQEVKNKARQPFESLIDQFLAKLLPRPIQRKRPNRHPSFHGWRELFSSLGVARVLFDLKEYPKTLEYLQALFGDNMGRDKAPAGHKKGRRSAINPFPRRGARGPFSSADPAYTPERLHKDGVRLAVEAHLGLALAEMTKVNRDFSVMARHWKLLLALADQIGERRENRKKIVETCLGVAKNYSEKKKFSIGIRFLEACNRSLKEEKLIAKIAAMKNVLAVAHSEREQFSRGWRLMRQVMNHGIAPDTYLFNYFHIGFRHIQEMLLNRPASARKVAGQLIETLRDPQFSGQKIDGHSPPVLVHALAGQFLKFADEIGNDKPQNALNMLCQGKKLGLLEHRFDNAIGNLIQREYRKKNSLGSVREGEAYLERLRGKYQADSPLLNIISRVEKGPAMASPFHPQAGLASVTRILALMSREPTLPQKRVLTLALESAYLAGRARPALELLAKKCHFMGKPAMMTNLCVDLYFHFMMKALRQNHQRAAARIFKDACVYFPVETVSQSRFILGPRPGSSL